MHATMALSPGAGATAVCLAQQGLKRGKFHDVQLVGIHKAESPKRHWLVGGVDGSETQIFLVTLTSEVV